MVRTGQSLTNIYETYKTAAQMKLNTINKFFEQNTASWSKTAHSRWVGCFFWSCRRSSPKIKMTLDCKLSLQPATKGHLWLLISNIFLNPLFLLPTFCHMSQHFLPPFRFFTLERTTLFYCAVCLQCCKRWIFWGRLLLRRSFLLPSEAELLIPVFLLSYSYQSPKPSM